MDFSVSVKRSIDKKVGENKKSTLLIIIFKKVFIYDPTRGHVFVKPINVTYLHSNILIRNSKIST